MKKANKCNYKIQSFVMIFVDRWVSITVAQPGFGGGGHGGLGNGSPLAGSRTPGAEPLVGGSGGIASRKLRAVIKELAAKPCYHVYLAQRRSQKFSCKPNFGGGAAPAPLAAPLILTSFVQYKNKL